MEGIRLPLYSGGIEIISICNDSTKGIESYRLQKPDVVIMDANWPDSYYSVSGSKLIQHLKEIDPACKIIVSTDVRKPQIVAELAKQGIDGYFYRNMNNALNAIINCIRKVYNGEKCFYDS